MIETITHIRPGERYDAVRRAIAALDTLGSAAADVWSPVRRKATRVDQLELARSKIPKPTQLPNAASLVAGLVAGDVDPSKLVDLLESASRTEHAEQARTLINRAVGHARAEVESEARRRGDRLVSELNQVIADDPALFERAAGLLDLLRVHRVLPSSSTSAGYFDPAMFRSTEDGSPVLLTAREVHERLYPARKAGRAVTAGRR